MEAKKRTPKSLDISSTVEKRLINFKGGLDKSEIRSTYGGSYKTTVGRVKYDQTGGFHHFHGPLKKQ